MLVIIIFLFLHWYLSLFSQTFFYHRYAAHKMFTMSRFWQKFFFIFSWITMGSSYLNPRAYGILHRLHHAYADTEKDPHSPKYDDNIFWMMWKTKNIYQDIFLNKMEIDQKFKTDLPVWNSFSKITDSWYLRFLWAGFYLFFYLHFATDWWLYLLLPVHFVMGPLHGAIINWFAHKFGYVNFKLSDTSKNFLPVDVLMLGESYHNNHHKRSGSPNFGFRWFELDPVYLIIKILDFLGIIKIRK